MKKINSERKGKYRKDTYKIKLNETKKLDTFIPEKLINSKNKMIQVVMKVENTDLGHETFLSKTFTLKSTRNIFSNKFKKISSPFKSFKQPIKPQQKIPIFRPQKQQVKEVKKSLYRSVKDRVTQRFAKWFKPQKEIGDLYEYSINNTVGLSKYEGYEILELQVVIFGES